MKWHTLYSARYHLSLCLSLCLIVPPAVFAQAGERLIVHAGHLMVSPHAPLQQEQTLVIEAGRILEIVPGIAAAGEHRLLDLSDHWVLPGLIDLHAHVTLLLREGGGSATDELVLARLKRRSATVITALGYAQAMLDQGFTTLRVPGDPTGVLFDLRDAIASGAVVGPRLFGTQAQITVSGGDYDPLALPGFDDRTVHLMHNHGVCSGADDCQRAVRQEVRSGADFIKTRISGGARDGLYETEAELRAIIDTAHRLGKRVAVHSHNPHGASLALRLGADTIEHGLPPDGNFDLFHKAGTGAASAWFVPTLTAFYHIGEQRKLEKIFESPLVGAIERLRTAYAAGVPIAFGSDAGAFPHGEAHREFPLMRDAGMSAIDIIASATVVAAEAMGKADEIGTLAPGKQADFIAVRGDPTLDITWLQRVDHVVKAGRLVAPRTNRVRSPGEPAAQTE